MQNMTVVKKRSTSSNNQFAGLSQDECIEILEQDKASFFNAGGKVQMLPSWTDSAVRQVHTRDGYGMMI